MSTELDTTLDDVQIIDETDETEIEGKPSKASKGRATFEKIAQSAGKVFYFDPRDIIIEENFNVRDWSTAANKRHLDFLAESIAEKGVQNPGRVRMHNGKPHLVAGESRLRATLVVQETDPKVLFPAIVENKGVSEIDRTVNLHIDNTGKQFEPLELALICARLSQFKLTDSDIAQKLKISGAYVGGLLKLNAAPEKLKALVRREKISATYAIKLIRELGAEQALETIQTELEAQKASGDDDGKVTEAKVKSRGSAPSKATEPYYKKAAMNDIIMFVCELVEDNSLATKHPKTGEWVPLKKTMGVRKVARKVLEDNGVNIEGWLEEAAENAAKAQEEE